MKATGDLLLLVRLLMLSVDDLKAMGILSVGHRVELLVGRQGRVGYTEGVKLSIGLCICLCLIVVVCWSRGFVRLVVIVCVSM